MSETNNDFISDVKHYMCTRLCSFILLLISLNCFSQDNWWKLEEKDIWAVSTMFAAGYFDGTAELLKWDYESFEGYYGDANDEWWNPEISWKNKYKNGDKSQGATFFGSRTFLVGTTDAYHAARSLRNLSLTATLFLVPRQEFNFKRFVFRMIVYTLANRAGFHLAYSFPRYLNK